MKPDNNDVMLRIQLPPGISQADHERRNHLRWQGSFSRPRTDSVFSDDGERGFAVKIQQVWSWWEEGLITTTERIKALREIEFYETARVTGKQKKEILRQSVRLNWYSPNNLSGRKA